MLWSRSYVPTPSPLRLLIADRFIEEKSSGIDDIMETAIGSYSLQWDLSNEFGLIFVVAYQRILQLTYITDLLDSMKSLFTSLYRSILETTFNSWIVPRELLGDGFKGMFKGWDQSFHRLLKDIERLSDRKRSGFISQRANQSDLKVLQREVEEKQTSSEQQPTAVTTATDAQTIAKNIVALKTRKKNQKPPAGRGGSRSGTDTDNASAGKSQKEKKTARKWTTEKISAGDIAQYDFSEDAEFGRSKNLPSNFIDSTSIGTRNQEGFYEVADYDRNRQETKSQPTLLSTIMSSIPIFGSSNFGPIQLTEADVRPMIEQIQMQLMKKNVAREIAIKICDRIQVELIGQKLSDRSTNSLKKVIYESLEISLTKILTPRTNIDVLAHIHQKHQKQKLNNFSQSDRSTAPYVMTFVGVNGVGKSTNLSKVAFWLLQNRLRVLIAACDTFRSGAVEQLRTHVRNLSQLDDSFANGPSSSTWTPVEGQKIELFERGYGKDAAGIAKEAIEYAKNGGFDVVLIDTAGRMQDNEPLMRALGKLILVNQPDKILFVGEALVGNEAVDQLSKFDKALKTFSAFDNHSPRGIDGIILTKFDTIDDKVGAALSMTYTINQPILFVGTGQTYTDLKNLKANHIVNALIR